MKCLVSVAFSAWALCGVASAQDYVGQEACRNCHANNPYQGFYDGYARSGHPWKLFHNAGQEPPPTTWPWTLVPPLPVVYDTQLVWPDVEYVIGNFFWKTRFVDRAGFIYTGDVDETTQWNIATQEWVPYHAGEVDKPFDCGRCHTTGYDPQGNQGGLPGVIGTWADEGVKCEACHGPASEHVDSFGSIPPPGGKSCDDCHIRDTQFRMPWSSGFMRHHQQSEDLAHSAHRNTLSCEDCHNPHKSTVYNDGGMTTECSTCHPGNSENNFYIVTDMEEVLCINCHMPKMAKSAVAFNEFTGDVAGHLFRVMTEPIAAADNVYEEGGKLYWNQDVNGDSSITLDYACLGCHIDIGSPLTLEEASAFADGIHTPTVSETICPDDPNNFNKTFGGPVTGDASRLCDADDVRLEVLQSARLSPLLPFIRLDYWANTSFDGGISQLDFEIECHVSALVGGGQNANTLQTQLKRQSNNSFVTIDTRPTGAFADETITHTRTTDAIDFVKADDGEILVRQNVFDPGNAFSPNWSLKVDLYEVTVTP